MSLSLVAEVEVSNSSVAQNTQSSFHPVPSFMPSPPLPHPPPPPLQQPSVFSLELGVSYSLSPSLVSSYFISTNSKIDFCAVGNSSWPLLTHSTVPGCVLAALRVWSPLVLTRVLRGRCYGFHFINDETDPRESFSVFPKLLRVSRAKGPRVEQKLGALSAKPWFSRGLSSKTISQKNEWVNERIIKQSLSLHWPF